MPTASPVHRQQRQQGSSTHGNVILLGGDISHVLRAKDPNGHRLVNRFIYELSFCLMPLDFTPPPRW
jgi:hypothetical protein